MVGNHPEVYGTQGFVCTQESPERQKPLCAVEQCTSSNGTAPPTGLGLKSSDFGELIVTLRVSIGRIPCHHLVSCSRLWQGQRGVHDLLIRLVSPPQSQCHQARRPDRRQGDDANNGLPERLLVHSLRAEVGPQNHTEEDSEEDAGQGEHCEVVVFPVWILPKKRKGRGRGQRKGSMRRTRRSTHNRATSVQPHCAKDSCRASGRNAPAAPGR